ncbi:hypothetical protein EDC01DRAFT_635525 [Geopyxis carbonaria]|nr:hypothetical protein EDC01DRAFT_635525 [Geopyxis carbonaria]
MQPLAPQSPTHARRPSAKTTLTMLLHAPFTVTTTTPPRNSVTTVTPTTPPLQGHTPLTSRTSTIPISTSSPTTTVSPANRVLSSFNPTQTYHIPPHGFRASPRSESVPILDLTPHLLDRKTASDPAADREALKAEVASLLSNRRDELNTVLTASKRGSSYNISTTGSRAGSVSGSRPSSREGSLGSSPVMTPFGPSSPSSRRGSVNTTTEKPQPLAKLVVPWSLNHPSPLTMSAARAPVTFHTPASAPRELEFTVAHRSMKATYRWRTTGVAGEWVLEKEAWGCGRYVVGVLWMQRGGRRGLVRGRNEGTLLFDERGVERVVVVASVLAVLRRERQRWGTGGGSNR